MTNKPKTYLMQGAYKKGQQAYLDGKVLGDNPYIMMGNNQDEWDRGYRAEEKASKDSKGQFTSNERF